MVGVGARRVVVNARSGATCRTGCPAWGCITSNPGCYVKSVFLPLSYAPPERSYASVFRVGSPMHGFLLQASCSGGPEGRVVDGSAA